jgi:hypothetical protein
MHGHGATCKGNQNRKGQEGRHRVSKKENG